MRGIVYERKRRWQKGRNWGRNKERIYERGREKETKTERKKRGIELTEAKKKAKAVPLQSWRRLGERRCNSYSFLSWALDGGEWSASHPGRALPRGKDHRYPLYRRLGGPQSRSGHMLLEKSFCLCRGSNLDLPVVQYVLRHYTDWATPAPA
jgi:hypothetical protein